MTQSEDTGSSVPIEEQTADETLTAAFERTVRQHGDRIALVSGDAQSTYLELNETANRLAHSLLKIGGGPGDRVAILMKDGLRVVTTTVAALKASRIGVVLNVRDPAFRLKQLVDDAEPVCIVTDAECQHLAAEIVTHQRIVRFDQVPANGPVDNPASSVQPHETALLIYTSGSAGVPKAVMITHRQFRRNTLIHTEAMGYSWRDRMPLFGALSSGQGAMMPWCALLNGATLYPQSVAVHGIDGLPGWMVENGITVYVSSASIFRSLGRILPEGFTFAGVRAVRLSSEAVTADDFQLFRRHFRPECTFVHTLSSSETCNVAVSRRSWHDELTANILPVGFLSKGGDVSLLGDDGTPVAPGQVGEIVVKSRYVASGYWRNPALTEERFSDALDAAGTRMVRTGDMARFNARGELEFCGRKDNRVKVRGNRVELSEVEIALRRLPGVQHAAVEAFDRSGQNSMLVGFVAAAADALLTPSRLRTELGALLPPYMVPSIFVLKDPMPIGQGGKIDRQALRQDFAASRQSKSREQSSTETEAKLAAIWSGVFERAGIGLHEDFFDLGGNSLIAAILAAKAHEAFGIELDFSLVADHPTVALQALEIDRLRATGGRNWTPIVPVPRDGPAPMSLSQEHWWRASRTPAESAHQVVCTVYRLTGSVDADVLRDCLNYLARRHEIFRTTFAELAGRPVQIVHPPASVPLPLVDLSNETAARTKALAVAEQEAARSFDLARLPLMRFMLVRLSDQECWLLRTGHHILFDAVQWWNGYWPELGRLYEAQVRGEQPPLAESASLQYADYAVWERRHYESNRDSYAGEIAWWESLFLSDPQPPLLPFLRRQPLTGLDPKEGLLNWGVSSETSRRLSELGRTEGATYYMVRLAVFSALLMAETGNTNMVVGTYASSFNRVDLPGTFGNFADLAPVVLRWEGQVTFREWLRAVRRRILEVQSNRLMSFELLRREMESRHIPLPDFWLLVNSSALRPPLRFADIELTWIDRATSTMRPGFTIYFMEDREVSDCAVGFDANRYDREGAQQMIGRLARLLEEVSLDPDKPLEIALGLAEGEFAAKALKHSEARRAALHARLKESEVDRAARLEVIHSLVARVEFAEAAYSVRGRLQALRRRCGGLVRGWLSRIRPDRAVPPKS